MSASDDELQALFAQHREALTHRPPPGLEQRLASGLQLVEAKEGRGRAVWLVAAGAAACALLVLAFELGRVAVLDEVLAGHVRSLMVDHLTDVASGDSHTVKPWFEGKLDFAPTVKDFTAAGFPLVGGRLDYLAGRPVAALVYRSNQHVINLFQWPASEARPRANRLLTGRGFQVYAWQREAMAYWAVSDLNAVDLQRFASLWTQ